MSPTTVPDTVGESANQTQIPAQREESADVAAFEAFRREKAKLEKAQKALEAANPEERAQFLAWKTEKAEQEAEKARLDATEKAVKVQLEAAKRAAALPPVRHSGQVRFAEAFVREHTDHLRHVHGIGWHLWTGSHWKADEERADIRAAMATIKSALRTLDQLNPQDRDALFKDIKRTESAPGIEGMLKIAGALRPLSVASSALDMDPHLFNMPNGTLHLGHQRIQPNSRSDLITKVSGGSIRLAVDDTAQREPTEWESFICRIQPAEDVRAFVQRLFGYAMFGKVTEHILPIFTGEGANGKGTLRDAFLAAFGDYAIEVDPAILMESKHDRHGTFKMRLRGARLVFCSETERGRRFSEATMKRLTGGDPIEANLMHRDPITFDPTHTLIMLTNHLPTVTAQDPAVWRRVLVVPFDVVIPEQERDGELPGRLQAASDEVLGWAYAGWLDYEEQGLNPPEVVRVRTQEYQAANDVLARFLEERTIASPQARIKARELYNEWQSWCHANGEAGCSENEFSELMKKRGYAKKRGGSGNVYQGLMIAADEDADEDE
jgi:putative DNA primase/helicase